MTLIRLTVYKSKSSKRLTHLKPNGHCNELRVVQLLPVPFPIYGERILDTISGGNRIQQLTVFDDLETELNPWFTLKNMKLSFISTH